MLIVTRPDVDFHCMKTKKYEIVDVRPLDFWIPLGARNDLIIQIDVFFHWEFNVLIDFDICFDLVPKNLDFHENQKKVFF